MFFHGLPTSAMYYRTQRVSSLYWRGMKIWQADADTGPLQNGRLNLHGSDAILKAVPPVLNRGNLHLVRQAAAFEIALQLLRGDLRISGNAASFMSLGAVLEAGGLHLHGNGINFFLSASKLAKGILNIHGSDSTFTLSSPGDPLWSNVVFLAGFDGTNGATTFSDESGAAHGAGTFSGSASLDTSQQKFGTASLHVTAGGKVSWGNSSDWVLSPSANSDLFTIAGFIRPASASNQTIASFGLFGPNRLCWELFFTSARQISLYFSSNGGSLQSLNPAGSNAITLNTWAHVQIDKDSGGKMRSYIDGTMMNSLTPGNSVFYNNTADSLILGTGVTGNFDGYIDEFELIKGGCRCGSDAGFTVPAAAYPRL